MASAGNRALRAEMTSMLSPASGASEAGRGPIPSERELRPHHDGIEIAADRGAEGRPGGTAAGRGRKPLVDAAVQVIEHEADIGVGVPVQPGRVDRLSAAPDGVAGGGGREAGGEMVVEADRAEAGRELDRAMAIFVVPRREQMGRNGVRIGSGRGRVLALLAGQDPASLDVAAVETVGRQPPPVDVHMIVFALYKEVAVAGGALDAVDGSAGDRMGGGAQPADAEDRGRVDPQLGSVGQRDRLNAADRRRLEQAAMSLPRCSEYSGSWTS